MKTIEEIYQEMLACFGERTGLELREGCDLSARLYALAAQVYGLYVQAGWVTRQAFPQTAEGVYLDYHAQLRGLERKPAVAARGTVLFVAGETAEADRPIPAGTVCMTAGLVRFETTREAVLPAGERTVEVPIQALVPGEAGNVSAGAILSMAVAPVGISSCANPEACVGGADQEGDDALRTRLLDTFLRLPNGANAAFYQQGALSFDRVAAAEVISRPRGTGTVDVVVATLEGLPDQELLNLLTAYFEERREIAVEVQVRSPETVTVDLAIRITPREGVDFSAAAQEVEQTLRGWFTGQRLGEGVLLAQLGSLIYGCDGVANYSIAAPAADLAAVQDVLPVLGALTVEELT